MEGHFTLNSWSNADLSTRYFDISLPTPFIATLETKRLYIVPTAMGRIPLSGLRRGVRGADATNSVKIGGHLHANHKLTTEVMTFKRSVAVADPSPHNASKICCALKPSLSHEVPLGNDLMQLKTLSISATRGGSENMMLSMDEGGLLYLMRRSLEDLRMFSLDDSWRTI
ncbi:hypothetical protein Tco_0063983 [Tanacetum coccineum]